MAHVQFDCEDTLPPLKSLLAEGVPSLATLETYIADLDVDLEENSKDLDSCLQDLMKLTNGVVGKDYITPKDALLSMISNHVLEEESCYDPEPDTVTDILCHASDMLENIPGCEEAVLEDLLSLSSKQGLSLPLKATVVDPIASTMSLNAVSNNSEMQIAQKWDQIALHLRRYFYDKLAHLTLTSAPAEIDLNSKKRLKYFQSLITLQPMEEVWDRYQELRSQQVEKCFNSVIPETDAETVNFLVISENCRELAQVIIQMINEDFKLLNSGILNKPANIFRAFHKIYLEKYSDEMAALIEEIWDEVRDSVKRGPTQSFSVQGSKGKGKQNSKSGSLLRNQAQSLDSIVSQFDNVGTDMSMTTIPTKYIRAILNIINTVLQIEEHVENLQKASLWDFGELGAKKTKRKGSLKGVLKPSSSPELKRPSSANMSSVDSETWLSDTMASSINSTTSSFFDQVPQPRVTVVEKMKLEDKLHWDWKMMFKKIAPDLGTGVDQHIRSAMAELLSQEQTQWSEAHSIVTVEVRKELWGGRMDYPKVISKAVSNFMEELDMFIPFAKAGQDGTLNLVRTAFVDVANLSLKNFHVHMTKISTDVPVHSAVKNLCVILSSAAYIRNYLLHYDTLLATDESKRPFSLLYKHFVELVDSLSDLLIQLHNNFITTSVLHDADSSNWAELKEFYEDERCSFPVQMWNYYLRGVQYDMWTICPPKLSQRIFGTILHDSLQILTQRYSQAKPSFRRIHQFRCDIVTILLCVSEMLYSMSSSISQCIDASFSQEPHHSIHNLCTSLLAAMTVIASPLETLYKINKKGYRYRKRRKHEQQAAIGEVVSRGKNTRWLSWIQSTIIQKGFKSYEDMRTTTAIYLHSKLLLCQPEINYALTLQAYLMKDFTLSILFLTQTLTRTETQSLSSDYQSRVKTDTQSLGAEYQSRVNKQTTVGQEFAESLFRVLIHCRHFPDSLVKVILPVIDRCQDWGCLDSKHVPGKDIPLPVWMECLFLFMKPLVCRVLKPVIEFVMSVPEEHGQITPISSLIEELPCGCRAQPAIPATPRATQSDDRNFSTIRNILMVLGGREMVDVVLHLVVNQLSEDIFVLPSPLCVLCKSLEENCASRGVKTPHNCAGIKLVAVALRHYLCNPHLLETAVGTNLDRSVEENLVLLSDCVYHVLVSGKVKGSSTPRLAGRFCKENREWMNDRLQVPVDYLNSEMFEATEGTMLVEATTEFQDQMYNVLACDILATPTGVKDLHRLYWMVYNNQDWLQQQLDIKQVLPLAQQSTSAANFVVDFEPKPFKEFNPTLENQMIGPCKFDHAAIEALQLDWEKLLQSDLGLSDLGFRSLLYNRHEMQDGAYLEDKERKPVATLRAVFENEPRELG